MKKICIIKVGNILAGLFDVILLGRAKDVAGWIAINIFNTPDCGCVRRQKYLNELFGCEDGVKLW